MMDDLDPWRTSSTIVSFSPVVQETDAEAMVEIGWGENQSHTTELLDLSQNLESVEQESYDHQYPDDVSDSASVIVALPLQSQKYHAEISSFDRSEEAIDVPSQVVYSIQEQQLDLASKLVKFAPHWNLSASLIIHTVEQRRVDLDKFDSNGRTALMNAAAVGDETVTNFLLQHGANPDVQTRYGYTALMFSCIYGRSLIVQMLLESGANAELQRYNGDRARELASHSICGFPFIVKILDDYAELATKKSRVWL